MTANKKKARSENWLEEDKQLLQELVQESIKTIENKNTDTNTNQQKKTCWNSLLDIFNSLCSGKTRTVAQLKTQWSSLKLNEKKKLSVERRKLVRTGGGPQAPIATTSNNDISACLPDEFVVDVNVFDSDTVNINKTSTTKDGNANNEMLAISSTEVECRKSLHAIQMEIEYIRKKNIIKQGRILEVEARVMELNEKAMQAKCDYYKKKMALLDSRQ